MKRLVIFAAVFLLMAALPGPIWSYNSEKQAPGMYAPGELIIKFKDSPSPSGAMGKIQSLRVQKMKIGSAAPIAGKANTFRVRMNGDVDVLAASKELMKNPDIEYAEPNYILRTYEVPNDPSFSQQWSLNRTNASSGWDITTGNSSVIIAIIDTGMDWDHPDLAANIWNNTVEWDDCEGNYVLNATNDHDDNGYACDVRGWDFVDSTSGYGYTCTDDDCDTEDNDPMDFNGHGTHCAGIAGAVTNNSVGVAGVCRNCTLMPLRAGWDCNTGYGCVLTSDAANAIYYATDNGANVISMSFGYDAPMSPLKDAIDYAYNRGVVLVAASGNSNTENMSYPASFDNVISVSATGNSDQKASYSNYGSWVDVSAPGGDGAGASQEILSTGYDDIYELRMGTSMACPFIAGLAGLILSKNSTYTPSQVATIIRSSIDPLSSSQYIGTGRVNVLKALVRNVTPVVKINPDLDNQTVNGTVSINGTVNGSAMVNYTVYYGSGIYPSSWSQINFSNTSVSNSTVSTWDTRYLENGNYTIRVLAYDSENQASEDRVVLRTQNDEWIRNINTCSNLNVSNRVYNLTANVTANGTCMNISADNITLECNGFAINYSTSETGYGINNSDGYDNVTIRGCVIVQGGNNESCDGILLTQVNDTLVQNNTVNTNGNSSSGILFSGNNISIYANRIYTNGTSSFGIFDYGTSQAIISYNNITTIGETGYGISVYGNDTVYNNFLNVSGLYSNGIIVNNNFSEIINNTIYAIGTSRSGIRINGASFNTIQNIWINSTYDIGLWIFAGKGNNITNVTITSKESGLYLDGNSSENIIKDSKISSINSDAIYLENWTDIFPFNNTFYNNLLNGSTIPINFSAGLNGTNFFNTTNQSGIRTWSDGSNIGGNYYTNSSGNGYSDTCTDADEDGFCDMALNLTTMTGCTPGVDCGNNTDYLVYSLHYNNPPIVENLTLNCSDILNRTNGTLNGYFNFSDSDNLTSELTNSTRWFRNGVEETGFENQTIIAAENTTKHDVWIFSAGAFDGYTWTWVNSSQITIANTPPSIPALLSPVAGINTSNSTLNFTWNSSSDIDNDSISYILYVSSIGGTYGDATSANHSSLSIADGFYNWTVSANDGEILSESQVWNFTKDATAPSLSVSVSPVIASNGTNVTLAVNMTDAHPGSLWANITLPGSSQTNISISNNTPVNFLANATGDYVVTFYSNDTFANNASSSKGFRVEMPMNYSVNVVAYNLAGLSANVTVYYNNTIISRNSTSGGLANSTIPNYTYDIRFESFSNNLSVTLRGVNASSNTNRTMGFDKTSSSEYIAIYAVNNSYTFTGSADLNMTYGSSSYSNENYLGVYKCDSWNFQSRACTGTWTNITSSATQDTVLNTFTLSTSSFSSFAIKQEIYCGDAVCSSDETCSSCSVDCGVCPPSGNTILTGGPETATTTTIEQEIVIIRNDTSTEGTTTTVPETFTTTTTIAAAASAQSPAGELDFSALIWALAIPLVAGGAFLFIKNRKIQEMMVGMLADKSHLYKDLIMLEKESLTAKRDGYQTERIDDELVLAKRAIESGAFGSAKSHMDNAKSLLSLYKKTL